MILPTSDFYADKSTKDGLQCYCKKCKLARAKETYRPEIRQQKYECLRKYKKIIYCPHCGKSIKYSKNLVVVERKPE